MATIHKNFKTEYYIGLNDKDKKVQLYETQTMIRIICGCLQRNHVDNFSYSIINGCYKKDFETTIKVELFNDRLTTDCIQDLKDVLNQECIAEVKTNYCDIEFI